MSSNPGGSSFRLKGPPGLDCRHLQREAALSGILIEPGDVFFMSDPAPLNYFRLGFSAIASDRIEVGIQRLARVLRGMT